MFRSHVKESVASAVPSDKRFGCLDRKLCDATSIHLPVLGRPQTKDQAPESLDAGVSTAVAMRRPWRALWAFLVISFLN